MSYLAIFKRIIPFFLTFAAGLLIASIFIPISAPNFSKGEGRKGKRHSYQKLWQDYENVRRENDQLKRELEMERELNKRGWAPSALEHVPEAPPPAPRHRR